MAKTALHSITLTQGAVSTVYTWYNDQTMDIVTTDTAPTPDVVITTTLAETEVVQLKNLFSKITPGSSLP